MAKGDSKLNLQLSNKLSSLDPQARISGGRMLISNLFFILLAIRLSTLLQNYYKPPLTVSIFKQQTGLPSRSKNLQTGNVNTYLCTGPLQIINHMTPQQKQMEIKNHYGDLKQIIRAAI